MKRLTEKDNQGNWGLKGICWEQLHEGQVITRELWEKLYDEEDKHRWIPVTERLPEDKQKVLVSTNTGSVCSAMYTEWYGSLGLKGFLLNDGFLHMDDLTAWQPCNVPDDYMPVPNQDNSAGGWKEQMTSTFLGDSRK